ncbi:MAG: sulfotransferase family 2 domain-containing protein [Acidobacteriota bacterium]
MHIYKVAGTSIRSALGRYAHIPDHRLPFRILRKLGLQRLLRHRHLQHLNGHATAREIKQALPPHIFQSFFKFAFVRNPWDWQVSLYHFALQKESHPEHQLTKSLGSFEKYLEWRVNEDIHLQKDFVVDRDGRLLVDVVGKYTLLTEDFGYICRRLGVNSNLPHLNRSSHADYRTYYTPKTIQLVADAFKEDIEYFGYAFSAPLRKEPLRSSGETRFCRAMQSP